MSSNHTPGDAAEQRGERATGATDTSRRTFLKSTAAGALAAGGLAGVTGSAAAAEIRTPRLVRDGNLVRTEDTGEQVILRGLNIADPRRLNATAPARGKDLSQVIDLATSGGQDGWHAHAIRLTCHPGDIAGKPPVPIADVQVHMPPTFDQSQLETYCETHLDEAVDRCEERGVYAIVDYHRHWGSGSLEWTNDALSEEVVMFWNYVADRYKDRDHVLFEVYNEPTSPNMGGTPIVNQWSAGIWDDWIETCQPWVDAIRNNADNLTIVGSPMWSQYPEGSLVREPEGGNLGYAYHIYPGHTISETGDWDGTIEDGDDQHNGEGVYECWKEVPLFVTEFGWSPDSSYPGIGTTSGFGEPFFDWMEDKPIHWTAWCFDPTWLPAMMRRPFETGDATDSVGDPYSGSIPEYCSDLPCEWEAKGGEYAGELVRQTLSELREDTVPLADGSTPDPDPDPEPEPPASPDDQWTNSVTATSIELEWSPAADATSYEVTLGGDTETTTETTYTFTGLSPETEYEIALRSVNDAGTSSAVTTTVSTTEDGGDLPRTGAVSASFADTTLAVGDTTELALSLTEVPIGGIQEATLRIDLNDEVAVLTGESSFGDVWSSSSLDLAAGADDSTASLSVTDGDGAVSADATDVTVGTVVVEGVGEGATSSKLTLDSVIDDDQEAVDVAVTDDTLNVGTPDGEPDTCEDSMSVGDRTVCNVDDDALYEDLNADGELTHADVQEFFGVQHRPTWKQAEYFDFNGNEVVGHGDVLALFEDVATNPL